MSLLHYEHFIKVIRTAVIIVCAILLQWWLDDHNKNVCFMFQCILYAPSGTSQYVVINITTPGGGQTFGQCVVHHDDDDNDGDATMVMVV